MHVRKKIPEKEFIEALLFEANYRSSLPEWKARSISTLFLGGGTPTLFSPEAISEFISKLRLIWQFEDLAEISIEANPDTISKQKLEGLKKAGVNRVSIGVQTFSDKFLKILGRNHSSLQAVESVQNAKAAGFENINIDLMFSLPEQTLEDLRADINVSLACESTHISFYNLTIETGTPFFERQLAGTLLTPSSDTAADFMEEIYERLSSNGFYRYEVSNYAKEGFACKHNQAYWKSSDYLGLGPGAHSATASYDNKYKSLTKRWSNQSMPEKYIESPTSAVAWSESISGVNLIFEEILLGLRQAEGINIEQYEARLVASQWKAFQSLIQKLREEGFVDVCNDTARISLTQKGVMIADSVIEKFSETLRKV